MTKKKTIVVPEEIKYDDIYREMLGDDYTPKDIIDCFEVHKSGYVLNDRHFDMLNKMSDYQNIVINRLKKIIGRKTAYTIWKDTYVKEMEKGYLEALTKIQNNV